MITTPNPKLLMMMGINVVGIIAYLAFASSDWVEPQVRDLPGVSMAGPILWGTSAFPTLVAFFLLNFAWVVWGCVAYFRKKKVWMLHPIFWLIPLMWAFAIYIDFSQHGVE